MNIIYISILLSIFIYNIFNQLYIMNVYLDGVFDLFHIGHLEAIKKVKEIAGDGKVIIGIVSDKDAVSYKRMPIINENDRIEIIKNLKLVDKVIFPCPMSTTKDFIDANNIDLVVHGFSDDDDWEKQKIYFNEIIKLNKFKKIEYSNKSSTSSIISKIKNL
jgi:choline-phosphate cytidylyltransferase